MSAQQAAPTAFPCLPKEAVNALPLRRWEGPVRIIRDEAALDAALEELASETLLGFDTEKRPCFTKGHSEPTSLLQLGGAHTVFIFKLLELKRLPRRVAEILADPTIIKTGVAVRDDIRELREVLDFEPAGFVDLSEEARSSGVIACGLRNLAANFLGLRVSKKERCSNWARVELTHQQITYAATDAWVSRELYLAMRDAGVVSVTTRLPPS